jgi:nicotinamide-nucleotide adenylyltransferase
MRSLFIGRFQPFHLGHLSVVQNILKEAGELIIAIGSAEQNFLYDNPFTASERLEIIRAALDEAKIPREKYWLVAVRNIENYALWVEHVTKLVPQFQVVYTGSAIVRELFEAHGGFEVRGVEFKINASGTKVREMMERGSEWKSFLPKSVAEWVERLKGCERVQIAKGI